MSEISTITTHVLDLTRGQPATSVGVALERRTAGGEWETLGTAETNVDGRVVSWTGVPANLPSGRYRLRFATTEYFARHGLEAFFVDVTVTFEVRDPGRRHHVPLLLSPYGYSTYRGS